MKNNWFVDGVVIFGAAFLVSLGAYMAAFNGSFVSLNSTFALIFGIVMYLFGVLFSLAVANIFIDAFYVWYTREMPRWGVVVYDMFLFVTLSAIVLGGYLIYNTGTHRQLGTLLCMLGTDALLTLAYWHYARLDCRWPFLPTSDSYGDVH